jgi:hypothetical protein
MWWIPAGQLPGIEEGKERLEYLREHGDSEYAFSFKKVFPMPTVACMAFSLWLDKG